MEERTWTGRSRTRRIVSAKSCSAPDAKDHRLSPYGASEPQWSCPPRTMTRSCAIAPRWWMIFFRAPRGTPTSPTPSPRAQNRQVATRRLNCYLVDTNVVSEARRGSRHALTWLRSVPPERIYLSALTLGEIMRGVALRRKSDPQTASPDGMARAVAAGSRRSNPSCHRPGRVGMGADRCAQTSRRHRRADRRDSDHPRPDPGHAQRQRFRRCRAVADQSLEQRVTG